MKFVSDIPISECEKTLHYHQFMRNKQRSLPNQQALNPFWHSSEVQSWGSRSTSSLLGIRGTFQSRFEVIDFGVNLIELVQEAKLPVLWAFKSSERDKESTEPANSLSTTDLLKHLVSQALCLNHKGLTRVTEHSAGMIVQRFKIASTEEEWLELLCSILTSFSHIYLVIDMSLASAFNSTATLPARFRWLFRELSNRGSKTIVKVCLVSCSPDMQALSAKKFEENSDVFVHVKRKMPSASASKRGQAKARTNLARLKQGRSKHFKLPLLPRP